MFNTVDTVSYIMVVSTCYDVYTSFTGYKGFFSLSNTFFWKKGFLSCRKYIFFEILDKIFVQRFSFGGLCVGHPGFIKANHFLYPWVALQFYMLL